MSDLGVKICGCIHAVPTNHSKSVTQWFECRNRECRNEGRPADPVTCELCPMRDSGKENEDA